MPDVLSIAEKSRQCKVLFEKVCNNWMKSEEYDDTITSRDVEIQQQKYLMWSKNMTATQDGHLPTSLEYRIRANPTITRNLHRILDYLQESLESILEIIDHNVPNETWIKTPLSSGEREGLQVNYSSDLKELLQAVRNRISDLFRLSIAIRKSPATDEYEKAALRYPEYEESLGSDSMHVRDKYPDATGDTWLLDRLGVAITRRRQYLRYRNDHQRRLEQVQNLMHDGKTVGSMTQVSTDPPVSLEQKKSAFGDGRATSDEEHHSKPITIYDADSSRGTDGATKKLRTPPLPLGVELDPGSLVSFECPYCHRLVEVKDKREWKKHVLSDLRPYVCTYMGCKLNMFESRNDWWAHEINSHRKVWLCKIEHCTNTHPQSKSELENHLQVQHSGTDSTIDESWRKMTIDSSECPLCHDLADKIKGANKSEKCDVKLGTFRDHLGLHFEQLALAALPIDLENITENPEEETDDDDSFVTTSSAWTSTIEKRPGGDESSLTSKSNRLPDLPLRDLSGRRRISKTLLKLSELFGSAQEEHFDDRSFKRGPALDYPTLPEEKQRNDKLPDIMNRYNHARDAELYIDGVTGLLSHSRAPSFNGSVKSGLGIDLGESPSPQSTSPRKPTLPAERG